MQQTEVTNQQWRDGLADVPFSGAPSQSHPHDPAYDHYPVESLLWADAIYFANQLSALESRTPCNTYTVSSGTVGAHDLVITSVSMNSSCTGYRLPTEAEWEYSARATTTELFANPLYYDASHNTMDNGFNRNYDAMGWYIYNNEMKNTTAVAAYGVGTKPVAKRQANAWGLYDMHGNVQEWVWDMFGGFTSDAVVDPTGNAQGSNPVYRGGSYIQTAKYGRSSSRNFVITSNHYANNIGFRLVLQGE